MGVPRRVASLASASSSSLVRLAQIVIALLTCVASACSLFTDLSGLSASGGGDGGGLDSTVAGDGPFNNGNGNDASGADGSSPINTTPFCSSPAGKGSFCDDFSAAPAAAGWFVAEGDGKIVLDPIATSALTSLRISIPNNVPLPPFLSRSFQVASLSSIVCEVSLRREAVDETGLLIVLQYDLLGSGSEHVFAEVKNSKNGGKLYVQATDAANVATDTFPDIPSIANGVGVWGRVQWTLDQASKTSTIKLDGTTLYSSTVPVLSPAAIKKINLTLRLTPSIQFPNSPWAILLDDLVCTFTP